MEKVKGQPGWEGCEFSHQCETRLESCARESGYQIITKYDDLKGDGKTYMSED